MIYKVETIFTFRNINRPLRMRYNVDSTTITEDYFYHTLLNELTREELLDLVKISICQECENEAEVLPFINICKGKIFLDDPNDPFRGRILDIRNHILGR